MSNETTSSYLAIFPALSFTHTKNVPSCVTFITLDSLHSTGNSVVSVIAYCAIPEPSFSFTTSVAVIVIVLLELSTFDISALVLSIFVTFITFSETLP